MSLLEGAAFIRTIFDARLRDKVRVLKQGEIDVDTINYEQFVAVDMRVGKIVKVEYNEKAKKPAYKLWVDFGGEIGVKQSSAQVTELYSSQALQGRLVVAVVNFPPKTVAGFKSEILILGVPNEDGKVLLLSVDDNPPLGSRVF